MDRFEIHSHTHYSNLRLLDCINKPKTLIDYARKIGLKGIAITDHEALCSHIEANMYSQDFDDFKVALGNEIYLCPNREKNQKYYHFILIAKNAAGHEALRILSSKAWMNCYWDRGMERCVTTYQELAEIVKKYPNSLIASSACLGGEVSTWTKNLILAEKAGNQEAIIEANHRIIAFITFCKTLFGEDFYLECAPGQSKDQVMVNRRMVSIATAFGLKMVIGTDAHYLRKEDRYVHKAYLNSRGGEREVDDFYEYAYLQTEEEIIENLKPSGLDYNKLAENSMEIFNKIEKFSLLHKQGIPMVEVKDYPKSDKVDSDKFPILYSMCQSDDKVERYWINQCVDKLEELGKKNDVYLARLEEEADTKRTIGEKLETNMFAYPVTLQHYIDMMWECGSTVGAGRGSSCSGLNHYLLGVTQLDPIKWDLPWFRYLNKERIELPDIDIDISPSRRNKILDEIRKERGANFDAEVDELSRENLGCTLVATFGTESTKSAILTACRGYRDENNEQIDVDEAQYMSSLIPQERGFLWPLHDVVYGNTEKDREPVNTFINEVSQYPGLLEIMTAIEGLINHRGSHASGVIFFDKNPYEHCAFMRTSSGDIITQYDLHMCEAAGLTKFDFLVTEVQDKIIQAIKFLQEDNQIDPKLTLREVYDKYFHPEIMPIEEPQVWDAIQKASVLDLFQLDSDVGRQGAKKIKPSNIKELADTNGLIRLMPKEKGAETPMDKYIRFKNNINLWYQEMDNYGLTKQEQKYLEPYFLESYGVPPSQEQLMRMLMDEHICGFSLKEANNARKIVGKKKMKEIPALHQSILDKCSSENLGKYVWDCGVGPQMGYSFSTIHALAYSFIGYQTAYIATRWNPIYWNTACLIVNSASLESDDEDDDIPQEKKNKSTDYAKIAKALGAVISNGIKVSLININKSGYGFEPDATTNTIIFGLKGVSKINSQSISKIMAGRPYKGIIDFMTRCPLTGSAMVELIKAGAFDETDNAWASKVCPSEPRKAIMMYYLLCSTDLKNKVSYQSINGLISANLIPQSFSFIATLYKYNKYLTKHKIIYKNIEMYELTDGAYQFYHHYFYEDEEDSIRLLENNKMGLIVNKWKIRYARETEKIKNWILDNQEQLLKDYNKFLMRQAWEKYAAGNISAWEMESVCFYYHNHELSDIRNDRYGIQNYFSMSSNPIVERTWNGIPIFSTYRIAGTVLSKNDARSSISLLTTKGVVNVKFTKEYFAEYNRQLSEKNDNGEKHVVEKSWFTRGNLLIINGFRRDDTFVAKTYKNTVSHQIYKIKEVLPNGDIQIEHERGISNEED